MSDFIRKPTAVICLSPYHGGMEMDAIRIAKMLQQASNITLVVRKNSPLHKRYQAKLREEGIHIEGVPFHFAFSIRLILSIRRIIKKYGIHNVIFFGASEIRSLFFSFLGLPVNLLVRHGTTKSRSKKDPIHRLVYSHVNWHIAICKHIANNVRSIIPFGDKTQLKIIYPSLRHIPTFQSRTANPAQPLRIVHVSRVTGGKGHIDAIEACKAIADIGRPFELLFVGEIDTTYKHVIDTKLSNLPYSKNIRFEGFVQEPIRILETADIFLFPSHGEGLSNAFIEALAQGIPCVAYDNTSFPELSDLGFRLWLASDRNTTDLQEKLLSAIAYLDTHKEYIRENHDLAISLFSVDRETHDYLSILQ